jgi:lysozyme family protein
MTPAVSRVIAKILEDEGGIKDVGDGKGVTRFGQTPAWLTTHGLPIPETPEDAAHNYDVWMQRYRLSDLVERDEYFGWLVTDFAVHSTERQAIRLLQRAIVVPEDGVIGPVTVRRYQSVAGTRVARVKFFGAKLRYYGDLLASTSVDRRRWARGWMDRVADQLEALP